MAHGPEFNEQNERIWKLHKQGVANAVIVQRLALSPSRVSAVIRRMQKAGEVVAE